MTMMVEMIMATQLGQSNVVTRFMYGDTGAGAFDIQAMVENSAVCVV